MQPIRAILYLDWLRREPANAIHHMANDTILSTKQLLNDEQEKHLDSNIERLRKMVDDRKRKQIEELYDINEINDQSDMIY